MTGKRKNYNEHRVGKKTFQAFLTQDENDLVQTVKMLCGATTGRELLLTLCREKKQQIECTNG